MEPRYFSTENYGMKYSHKYVSVPVSVRDQANGHSRPGSEAGRRRRGGLSVVVVTSLHRVVQRRIHRQQISLPGHGVLRRWRLGGSCAATESQVGETLRDADT